MKPSESLLSSPTEIGAELHPDMKAAIDAIVQEKIPRLVKWGLSSALDNQANTFGEILAVSNATLTESGKKYYAERVSAEVAANLNQGLLELMADTVKLTQWGISAEGRLTEIRNLCELGRRMNVPISVMPKQEDGVINDPGTELLRALTTEEEIITYCQDHIERNILRGVESTVEDLAESVKKGRMNISRFDSDMAGVLERIKDNGFNVVDEPIPENKVDLTISTQGILLRQVNVREIADLKESAIRLNLVKGFEALVRGVAENVKSGESNPLNDFNVSKGDYIAEAERRGIVNRDLDILSDGVSFNPDLADHHVKEAIRKNIATGLEKIVRLALLFARDADINMVECQARKVEEYLNMAQELGINVENADETREYMQNINSPENIQMGVNMLHEKIKQWLRDGDFSLVKSLIRKISVIKKYVHEKGLDDRVDFNQIEAYVDEVKLGTPTLKE